MGNRTPSTAEQGRLIHHSKQITPYAKGQKKDPH